MSFSGSSDSRKRSCATIRLAMSSSTGVPRKTMRSLQQPGVDVVGPLAAIGLLDDDGDEIRLHGHRPAIRLDAGFYRL